jgi:prevent-host-death family protein
MRTWTLQDAKARFSELVTEALKGVPQRVLRRGRPAVVVLSAAAYDELTKPKDTLVEFFARSPHREIALGPKRSKDGARVIELHHNLTIVTRNERDFRRSGAAVVNPWQ